MEIKQLLAESHSIWGGKKCNLSQIIVRLGKVFGDICRYERGEKAADRVSEHELKKELGNLIFSTIRFCDDLGYDPQDCIALAKTAQIEYQKGLTKR